MNTYTVNIDYLCTKKKKKYHRRLAVVDGGKERDFKYDRIG